MPACSKSSVTGMYPPAVSGLDRFLSTTDGCGPVRLTAVLAGSVTEPPSRVTLAAEPAAEALISVSLVESPLNSDRKRPADEPAGTVEPDGAPSTKTLLIWIPLRTVCAPADAAWNSSVGASFPASHPAMAGISRARAPTPMSRRPAAVFPKLARITAKCLLVQG